MPVTAKALARDERGTTLVELLVGMSMGMVVITGLTMVIVASLHASARITTRVEATQNGRVVLTKIIEELHSACVVPKIAPIQKESTGTSLRFVHAASGQGGAVSPTPVYTVISLSNGILTQSDYAATGGTAPNWTWAATPNTTRLMSKVVPLTANGPIFTYYSYLNGGLSLLSTSPSLSATDAAKTIEVKIELNVSPATTPVKDAGADTSIQDSAVLRLTPPSFNENATAPPCV